MKYTLGFLVVLIAFGINAQKKLIASNFAQFDQNGSLTYTDSNEYIYNSWDGSLFSHEPVFGFNGIFYD